MSRDGRRGISKLTTPMWPAILAGMVVGGLAGAALSFQGNSGSEATALIRLYQPVDPDQIITGAAPSPDSQQSYISGEIAYLGSPGFNDAVAEQVDEPSPLSLTAVQDGQSSVISISATQPRDAAAQRVVGAALSVYREYAQQQNRQRGQEAIDAMTAVIDQLQSEVVAPAAGDPRPNDAQARVAQLDLQRLAIEVQTRRGAPIQVVQPPTVTREEGLPTWSLGAVAGALIGGLLTVAGILAWRRRAGVIATPDAAESHVELVLRPEVGLGGLSESKKYYLPLARNLYAQLPDPRSGRILVVGASVYSGSEAVAGLLAAALREHTPSQLVHLQGGSPIADVKSTSDPGDAATVVIDGGSVDTTPALPEAAAEATQIIVVIRLGHDTYDDVRVVSQLARRNDIPISAVCTRRGLSLGKAAGKSRARQRSRAAGHRKRAEVEQPAPVRA